MKKFAITILVFTLLFTITGCGKSDNKEKYVNLLNEYVKDSESLNNKSYPATYSKFHYKIYSTSARGNISNVLYDLDDDNDYEGLKFDFGDEAIDVTLLEFKDDKIQELDSKFFLNLLPEIDEFNLIVFAMKLNDKPYFFLEINGSSSLLADGNYYELRSLTTENNKIVVSSPIIYEASAIDEDGEKDYLNYAKRMGLNAKDINKTIYSQNEKAIKIFEITRKHLKDFKDEDVGKLDGEVQYGKTTFKDNLFEKYIINLENVKTTIDTDNMEYEFKPSNLGKYTYENTSNSNAMNFELNKNSDKYDYILLFYPNGSTHASEELWGTWDVTKKEFNLNNENEANLADYKIKNVKYSERNISFEIELIKLKDEQYKDYVIPNGTYNFIK